MADLWNYLNLHWVLVVLYLLAACAFYWWWLGDTHPHLDGFCRGVAFTVFAPTSIVLLIGGLCLWGWETLVEAWGKDKGISP